MFRFLKKWLAKPEHIAWEDLEQELQNRVQEKEKEFKKHIEELNVMLTTQVEHTTSQCSEFLKKTLHNDKITKREKQFMQGNREAYVKALTQYVHQLPVFSRQNFFNQIQEYKEKSTQLAEKVQRPKQILSHFFARELREIEAPLKTVAEQLQRIEHYYTTSQLQSTTELLKDLKTYAAQVQEKKKTTEALTKKRAEYSTLQKRKEKIDEKMQQLRDGARLRQAKQEITQLKKRVQDIQEQITDLFASLRSPLKKYAKQYRRPLAAQYSQDSLEALSQDMDLRINTVLKECNDALHSLDLKPDKLQKAQQAFNEVTPSLLSTLQQQHALTTKRYEQALQELREHPDMVTLQDLKEQLAMTEDAITAVQHEITSHEKQLQSFAPESLHHSIIRRARERLRIVVT
ncbi:hypothetical protein GF342_03850 [Candidatus Woesearchaeota archaeon]|nr:hypothetical protein [Candidatus Woesearchaeota archaeon]